LNKTRTAVWGAALAAVVSLFAGTAMAEMKVGFVDTAKLMESAPQVKEAQSKIEAEFAPREKELVELQRKIRAQEDRLSRDSAVMSESENTKLERDILAMRRDLKRSQEEFRDDLNIRRNEVLAKLQREIFDAIVAFAKAQNYDLIMGQGVVYSSERVDITEAVLKQLTGGR
jgi:outer membrane protein